MDESQHIKKAAEEFSMQPPAEIWEKVDAELGRREKKRRIILFALISVAFLSTGIFLGVLFSGNHPEERSPVQHFEQEKNIPALSSSDKASQNLFIDSLKPQPKQAELPAVEKQVSSSESNDAGSFAAKAAGVKPDHSITTTANSNVLPKVNVEQTSLAVDQSHTSALVQEGTVGSSKDSVSENLSLESPAPWETISKDMVFAPTTDSVKVNPVKSDSVATKKDTVAANSHKGKWTIGISAAPLLSFTSLEESGDYRFVANYRDSSDKKCVTGRYVFNLGYRLLPELEIFSGLGISSFEEEILNRQVVYKIDTNHVVTLPVPLITISRGYQNLSPDSSGTTFNRYTYLEIPLGFRYEFLSGKKLSLGFEPQLLYHHLLNQKGVFYDSGNQQYRSVERKDLNSGLLSWRFGLSLNYRVSEKVSVDFSPGYEFYSKSLFNKNYSMKKKLEQLSAGIGVKVEL